MQRIQYRRYGGPEEMRLEEFALPPLRAGQVLVRVKAASVNPFDWKLRAGEMITTTQAGRASADLEGLFPCP